MSVSRGQVAGSMRKTIENLREANAGLAKQLAEARVLNEVLNDRIKGLHVANDSFGDLAKRVEDLEREKAELLPGVDALHRRIKGLERERDEWRDVAKAEGADEEHERQLVRERDEARAAIVSLQDNADVWEKRALATEAEIERLRAELEHISIRPELSGETLAGMARSALRGGGE